MIKNKEEDNIITHSLVFVFEYVVSAVAYSHSTFHHFSFWWLSCLLPSFSTAFPVVVSVFSKAFASFVAAFSVARFSFSAIFAFFASNFSIVSCC